MGTKIETMKWMLSIFVITVTIINLGCSPKPKETVKVGYIPIADCSQLFIAYEKGFFSIEGINVELKEFQGGPQIMESMLGGSIQIGFSNVISLININAQGNSIKAISGGPVEKKGYVENSLISLDGSGISNAQSLEGRTVAVNARKNIIELFFREYMLLNDANPDNVKLIEMKFSQMQPALLAGKIDAAAVIEPYVTLAKNHQDIREIDQYFIAVMDVIEISTYNSKDNWINANEQNREIVEKFRTAMKLATQYCKENPDEVRRILSKYTKLDSATLQSISLPSFTDVVSADNLQVMIEKMKKNNWLDKDINASSLIYHK